MTVVDENKIDGIAQSNNNKKLMMLIADHIDWKSEHKHLCQLQKKINSYIAFLESRQYRDIYPEQEYTEFCIEIHFMYVPTDKCNKYLESVNSQLSFHNISISVVIS